MKIYKIPFIKGRDNFKKALPCIEKIKIEEFPWDTKPKPAVWAAAAYDDTAVYIHMEVIERYIRAVHTEQNGAIYTDSCLEFYVRPCMENNKYFNIEINPIGTIYLSVGKNREERLLIDEEKSEVLKIETRIERRKKGKYLWSVTYEIPYVFIKDYIPEFDSAAKLSMTGNFYKCGNELPEKQWGCWNYVNSAKPDFHRPECFGRIIGI